MAPFLGALAIIVVVVIAIWLFSVFETDRTPEDQRVGRAAVGQNDALQREDFADFSAAYQRLSPHPEKFDEFLAYLGGMNQHFQGWTDDEDDPHAFSSTG